MVQIIQCKQYKIYNNTSNKKLRENRKMLWVPGNSQCALMLNNSIEYTLN